MPSGRRRLGAIHRLPARRRGVWPEMSDGRWFCVRCCWWPLARQRNIAERVGHDPRLFRRRRPAAARPARPLRRTCSDGLPSAPPKRVSAAVTSPARSSNQPSMTLASPARSDFGYRTRNWVSASCASAKRFARSSATPLQKEASSESALSSPPEAACPKAWAATSKSLVRSALHPRANATSTFACDSRLAADVAAIRRVDRGGARRSGAGTDDCRVCAATGIRSDAAEWSLMSRPWTLRVLPPPADAATSTGSSASGARVLIRQAAAAMPAPATRTAATSSPACARAAKTPAFVSVVLQASLRRAHAGQKRRAQLLAAHLRQNGYRELLGNRQALAFDAQSAWVGRRCAHDRPSSTSAPSARRAS